VALRTKLSKTAGAIKLPAGVLRLAAKNQNQSHPNTNKETTMRVVKAKFRIMPFSAKGIMKKIELIGRECYKSTDKIGPGTAEVFCAKLVARGHLPMFDHAHISVHFTIDRGVSHEVVRHRVAAYAQESTRYCNYSKDKFGKQITFIDIREHCTPEQFDEWLSAAADCERHYFRMLELGAKPEIARSVLMNSTKTGIWCTYDITEWRHFFSLRTADPAHPQMREVTRPLLTEFQKRLPVFFNDIHWDRR
jgi:thymidylate synthase (FAD)